MKYRPDDYCPLSRVSIKNLIHNSLINAGNQIKIAVMAYNEKYYGTSFMLLVFADEEIAKAIGLSHILENREIIDFKEIKHLFQHCSKHEILSLQTFAIMPMVSALEYINIKTIDIEKEVPEKRKEILTELLKRFITKQLTNPSKDFRARLQARIYYYGSEKTKGKLQDWRERAQYIGLDSDGIQIGPFEIPEVMAREYFLLVWENFYLANLFHNEKRIDIKKPPFAIPEGLIEYTINDNIAK